MKRTLSLALAAILVAGSLLAAAPGTGGASQIIVREGTGKLVAIPAVGGRPQVLARVPGEALIGTSASADGRTFAYSSRTASGSRTERRLVDKVWVKRVGRAPRVILTTVSVGKDRGRDPVVAVALSPNGRRLLVTRRGKSVLVLGSDGSNPRPLRVRGYRVATGLWANHSAARFTPSGRGVIAAFESTHAGDDPACGIGTVPLSGGEVHFLRSARMFGGLSRFQAPALSPDGRFVAFREESNQGQRLLVMRRDGSGAHPIAASMEANWRLANPTFSPSGRALAFFAEYSEGNALAIGRDPVKIFTVRRDGTHLRAIHSEKAHMTSRNPTWVR